MPAAAAKVGAASGPRSIRDLASWRLARLAGLNDRSGHAHLVETYAVTLGEWRVLAIVGADAPLTFAELTQRTLLDKGQLSRTVKGLVERGWVVSVRSPTNKRTVELRLSNEGQRQYRAILEFAVERNSIMLAGFTAAELATLFALLDRLTEFVEAEFTGLASASAREAEAAASQRVARGQKS